MKSERKKSRKIPKVRLALPAGRPFQLRYTDASTGREVRISTNTRDEAESLQQKGQLEAKLTLGIEARLKRKAAAQGAAMSWEEFRDSYTRLKVATFRSEMAKTSAESRLDICTRIINPRTLADMADPSTIATLQAELLAGAEGVRKDDKGNPRPRSAHSVRSYLSVLFAALNWAHRPMRWLPNAVEFDMMDCDDPDKGRPLTGEEFERMLAATPKVVGEKHAAAWKYLLRGLWESGLRLSEALALNWDDDGTITPCWPSRGLPYLTIAAKSQKSRKQQDLPITPAFSALLLETPEAQRMRFVFHPSGPRESRLCIARTIRRISAIGKKANIKVNAAGKSASAHDLRRSFGQRMADAGLPVRLLQKMMRHSAITTTEAFYLRDQIQDQAAMVAKYLSQPQQNERLTAQKANA